MNTKNTYTLKVGKGLPAERLEIVNECYNSFSLKCLQDIDLKGKTVLDVGCGSGLFACELARLVAHEGKVIAVDISSGQLEIAKENAEKQNLNNIEFIKCSAFELNSLKMEVDCIYSRFLLVHLENPVSVLKQELSLLKPGGYLISAEFPFAYDTISCYPKSETFDRVKELRNALLKLHSTDFSIGMKIPGILKELGCSLVYSRINQPMLDTPREKSQLRLGLKETGKNLISKGFFSEDELKSLSKELIKFEQSNHIVAYVSCIETCVQKS